MFKSKKKVLNYEKPIVTTYPHTANAYAIMQNNPYFVPNLAMEMVGLVYDKELDRLDFSISLEIMRYIKNYPLMDCYTMGRDIIGKKWKKFSDFVEDMLDEGYYIQLLVDTYYIRAYGEMYQREHFMHNPMIYGYDSSSKTVIMADSFEKGIYESRIASYDEINNGFLEYFFNDWLGGVHLCKLKEEIFQGTGYYAKHLVELINNHIEGKNSVAITYEEDKRRRDFVERFEYGLAVYDEITKYIERVKEEKASMDVRIFYALYDHFNLFRHMIEQLIQRKQIKDGNELYMKYTDFAERTKNQYMQVLKFNITHNEKLADKLMDECRTLKEDEKNALSIMKDNIVVDADISPDDSVTARVLEIKPESIYAEFDEDNHWHRRNLSEEIYYADKQGAYIKTQFYGRYVDIYVKGKENYGVAKVVIDDKYIADIDYSAINTEDVITIDAGEIKYHSLKLIKSDENGKTVNLSKIIVHEEMVSSECNAARIVERIKTGGSKLYKEYGKLGRDIVGAERQLPENMTWCNYRYEKAANVILMQHTADSRGVGRTDKTGNIVGYALSDKEFNLDMVIPGEGMRVSFYFVDYDRFNREMKLEIKNGDTDELILTEEICNFQEGMLLGISMKGHIKLNFVNTGAPDAVMSAIFWD